MTLMLEFDLELRDIDSLKEQCKNLKQNNENIKVIK